MAMAHPRRRLTADNASLLQRLAEGLDLSPLVAPPGAWPCRRSSHRRRYAPWAVFACRRTPRRRFRQRPPEAGPELDVLRCTRRCVIPGASIGSPSMTLPPIPGSEPSLEAQPGASLLRSAERCYQFFCFFSGTLMSVGLPSAGFFTSSIFALSLGRLEDDSLGADAEDAVSALPELVRCVVQTVNALPAEGSSWVPFS